MASTAQQAKITGPAFTRSRCAVGSRDKPRATRHHHAAGVDGKDSLVFKRGEDCRDGFGGGGEPRKKVRDARRRPREERIEARASHGCFFRSISARACAKVFKKASHTGDYTIYIRALAGTPFARRFVP